MKKGSWHLVLSSGILSLGLIQVASADNIAAPGSTVKTVPVLPYQSQTTTQVSIAPRDNLIVATTITNWDSKASDQLYMRFIAPKGSFCASSIYQITRGNNLTHDVSWAYRTVIHQGSQGQTITCSGKWVVEVINAHNGMILAKTGYVVPVANPVTPPPATVNTASTSAS